MSTSKNPAKVVFSGIQPTGVPHLGNYLGALSNWVRLQNQARSDETLIFSSVGLHALTMPQDPASLRKDRRDMIAALLSIGIDSERCILFQQERVRQHAELAWILNCITSMGKLKRITTWKSKCAIARNHVPSEEAVSDAHAEGELNLGLFSYPVLQAADILLYKATHVPVGEDQVQHLELSRDIASVFNRTFHCDLFPLPQHIIAPTKRVLSLRDPTQKMSKSAPDANSRILLTDSARDVEKKIKRAVTDDERTLSFDPVGRPGISNLLDIFAALRSGRGIETTPAEIAEELNRSKGGAAGAGTIKAALSEEIIATLQPIQDRLQRLQADPEHLEEIGERGAAKARQIAESTMVQVRHLVGLS